PARRPPGGSGVHRDVDGRPRGRDPQVTRRGDPGGVRILFVSESFLPHMNAVTTSVLRVVDHYAAAVYLCLIIPPGRRGTDGSLTATGGRRIPVHRIASVPLAGCADVRIATTGATALRRRIADFQPDVIHLASPTVLGGRAVVAAQREG